MSSGSGRSSAVAGQASQRDDGGWQSKCPFRECQRATPAGSFPLYGGEPRGAGGAGRAEYGTSTRRSCARRFCALRGDSAGDALSMNSLLPGGAEEQLPQSRCASAQGQGGTALREGHRRGRAVEGKTGCETSAGSGERCCRSSGSPEKSRLSEAPKGWRVNGLYTQAPRRSPSLTANPPRGRPDAPQTSSSP